MRRYWWIFLAPLLAGCAVGAAPLASVVTPTSPLEFSTPRPSVSSTPIASTATDPEVTTNPQPSVTVSPEPLVEIPPDVPDVDVTQHSVPLDQIYFDTFQPINRAVPLSQAPPDLIERLRDVIPPIHNPKYESAVEATWLDDQDVVIGYASGGQSWAYPLRILNFHEIVNDRLNGEPVLISYCPLCYSGIVYSRQLGDDVLIFGNTSALYESDMVMLDYQTGSYWWQVAGEAIAGSLTEERLTVLPSATITWGGWRELHPSTLVLSRDTGYDRNYDRDPFIEYPEILNNGRFAFPVSKAGRDARLQPATQVLAVKVGDEARAYPVTELERAAIMDTLGDQAVVVFTDLNGRTGAAYQPLVEGRGLTFEIKDSQFTDRETGSIWDLAGRAVSGPLQGVQLPAVPSRTSFWFAIIAAEPEITVYQAGAE